MPCSLLFDFNQTRPLCYAADLEAWFPDGFAAVQTVTEVPQQCGDELTLENLIIQAARLNNPEMGLALPSIMVDSSHFD
jgi:hypothetical protein